ncbi:hypothetical protein UVI_02000690 [Ustilaginoidea virens]|uniref:Hydrolase, TatD family protein n=1 Tax=Ustilaginoidea virens TaxID=1159556 RepID=A0A1B5L208_USTVR|nr:hypothetical protein UVI_02000690 [Ustilaginoidea virens]
MSSAVQAASTPSYTPRYIDNPQIGINLSDPIFRGRYHGIQKHPDDLAGVLVRARQVGCAKLIVTGSDLQSSRDALKLSAEYPRTCYATVGIHPCSSAVFGREDDVAKQREHSTPCEADGHAPMPEDILPDPARSARAVSELGSIVAQARSADRPGVVAMGEFGLDYDRLNYCNRVIQKHAFAAQLELAAGLEPQLPLFLHSRAAHADFVAALKNAFGARLERLRRGGVVHSFTGTLAEVDELMDLGLYIGINGCSFKTADNCQVVRAVRLDRIMLETDGPWCEVRPSHEGYKYLVADKEREDKAVPNGAAEAPGTATPEAKQPKKQKNQKREALAPDRFKVVKKEKWEQGAMVKGRNEPCTIERVAKIVAAIKGVPVEEVCEAAWRNTVQVFGLEESA